MTYNIRGYFKTSDSRIQHWNMFTTMYASYLFNQVLLTYGYWKLLPYLKIISNLKYDYSYEFGRNNFFFLDFNNFDL